MGPGSTVSCDEDLLRRLPLPLAQLYRRAHNAKSSQDRHHNAYYLAEAALKLAACLRIGAAISARLDGASPLARSLEQVCLPSVGHWVGFLRDSSLYLADRPDAALLPAASTGEKLLSARAFPAVLALADRASRGAPGEGPALQPAQARDAARQGILGFFGIVASYRNQVFGHGAQRLPAFYDELGPLLLAAAVEVLREDCLFGGLTLAVARTVPESTGRPGELEWQGLEGLASLRLPRNRTGDEPPGFSGAAGQVYFVGPGARVPLHPLVVYQEDRSERERIGFLNRASVRGDRGTGDAPAGTGIRRVEYLDYATGDHLTGVDAREALAALLARLRGMPASESDVDRVTDGSGTDPDAFDEVAARDAPGRLIGDFELEGELGRGGMGVVYRARQRSLNRTVALKVLPPSLAADPVSLGRFRREIASLARSDHPNLVKILTSGADEDRHYYAMELVEGTNLADLFGVLERWRKGSDRPLRESHLPLAISSSSELAARRRGAESLPAMERLDPGPPPPVGEGRVLHLRLAELFADAADALAHLHARGVLHRDLKPANLMLTRDGGRIVVMDLGLAQLQDRSQSLTRTGARWVGTLRYAAPEQLQWNLLDVDERADVYGLGASLYELTTLAPLFDGDTEPRLIEQVLHQEPRPAAKVEPAVPRDLGAIIGACIEKDRTRRYANARDLADDLRRFRDGLPVRARPVTGPQRIWRWCRRNPALASASGLAIASLAAVACVASLLAVTQRDNALRSQYSLAESYLVRGQLLCDRGDIDLGLHWMARGLKAAPAGAAGLEEAIRSNLGGWSRLWNAPEAILHTAGSSNGVAFSSDGKRILTASYGNARQWSVETGEPIGPAMMEGEGADLVAFSPDGKFLATVTLPSGAARLHAADGSQPSSEALPHPQGVRALAFSPDGRRVITGGSDGTARVWAADTGKPLLDPLKHDRGVNAVSFNGDGSLILTASSDGTARVWRGDTGAASSGPFRHNARLHSASFSPDGNLVLTAGDDLSARIWSMATGEAVGSAMPHQGAMAAAAFSPDGKRVLTASWDRTARLWSAETGAPLGRPIEYSSAVTAASFSPDGKLIVTATLDGEARLWTSEDGQAFGLPMRHRAAIAAVTFSPSGDLVATASLDFTVKVWRTRIAGLGGRPLPMESTVWAAAFSPDGKRLATGSELGSVALWSVATGERLPFGAKHPARVWTIAFSPDGTKLLAGGLDRTAKLWSADGGDFLGISLEHDCRIRRAIFSPDGKRIATTCEDGIVRLWSSESGALLRQTIRNEAELSFEGAAFSPDGKLLATCGGDPSVTFWSAETMEATGTPLKLEEKAFSVAFSPDGRSVATGGQDNVVRIWSLETRAPLGPPIQHEGRVGDVAFSPDGKLLLTSCTDKKVRIWSVETGDLMGPPFPAPGEFDPCAAFSPDGKRIATGGDRAMLWDLPGPIEGSLEHVLLWTRALTGIELTGDGGFRALGASEWRASRRQLEEGAGGDLSAAAPRG